MTTNNLNFTGTPPKVTDAHSVALDFGLKYAVSAGTGIFSNSTVVAQVGTQIPVKASISSYTYPTFQVTSRISVASNIVSTTSILLEVEVPVLIGSVVMASASSVSAAITTSIPVASSIVSNASGQSHVETQVTISSSITSSTTTSFSVVVSHVPLVVIVSSSSCTFNAEVPNVAIRSFIRSYSTVLVEVNTSSKIQCSIFSASEVVLASTLPYCVVGIGARIVSTSTFGARIPGHLAQLLEQVYPVPLITGVNPYHYSFENYVAKKMAERDNILFERTNRKLSSAGLTSSPSSDNNGEVTLVNGVVRVYTSRVNRSSRVLLTCEEGTGTPGFLRVTNLVEAQYFDIVSSSADDQSVVSYLILEVNLGEPDYLRLRMLPVISTSSLYIPENNQKSYDLNYTHGVYESHDLNFTVEYSQLPQRVFI